MVTPLCGKFLPSVGRQQHKSFSAKNCTPQYTDGSFGVFKRPITIIGLYTNSMYVSIYKISRRSINRVGLHDHIGLTISTRDHPRIIVLNLVASSGMARAL
jgi:hypothetical protein